MKELLKKVFNKKGTKKVRRFTNNKGFSLIELLIVIAIMGVLAAIAFNMFGGVLVNSKKRADAQLAKNIEKAIITYCVDSGDWALDGTVGGVDGEEIGKDNGEELIESLLQEITYKNESYGPILTPKFPELDNDDPENVAAMMPQWHVDNDGKYTGWEIIIYKSKNTVSVKPSEEVPAPGVEIE